MGKLIFIFILVTLFKSILLYLLILTGDLIPSIHILIRYLIYFLIIVFVDWKTIEVISKHITKANWIKFATFTYGTSFLVLWITGPIFLLHNYILSIKVEEDNGSSPVVGLIAFCVITLLISMIVAAKWVKLDRKSTANNGVSNKS